ncbi:uncharacterized protein BYT42DRAFT_95343 [Radiomyces spectabilis]|uniref:uncharacterized protein n=1 Tax=Radiomyces spectabilis TaxID=64574 RepID=UPI002220CD92|nr:uncharacterized protein BYT42DRAFT_95343 [Radiomyces spectabilis]KAI8370597.1 hypothetical protein BYT42DRAFT_95343 [Radiomyces spectabilis]
MRRQPVKRSSAELDDDNDFLLESTEPEIAHLRIAPRDWEAEWKEKLQHYQEFMKSYLDKETREAYWHAKQAWRRGLATTEMLLRNKNWQKTAPSETETVKPQARTQQASLSRFFAGVKKLKIDTPDELISNVRIPNDLYSGVKQITPLSVAQTRKTNDERIHYYELEDIKDCLGVLDAVVDKGSSDETHQSPLEGILVDPPWEFYVKDGRNDGHCHWNLQDVVKCLQIKAIFHRDVTEF